MEQDKAWEIIEGEDVDDQGRPSSERTFDPESDKEQAIQLRHCKQQSLKLQQQQMQRL